MEELISIIIPVYNVKEYVDKCVKSIINQTYKNLEIIIVDDGSTDGSGDICDEYKLLDRRIKVIHKENEGLSEARNVGINSSNGKYIGFVDSDDFVAPDMFEVLYNNIKNEDANISICSLYFSNRDADTTATDKNEYFVMDSNECVLKSFENQGMGVYAWNKLYEKELFENIKFPKGKKSEDRFIMYQVFDLADKIVYQSVPKYYYVQRIGSITHSLESINFDSIEASYEALLFIEKKYPESKWHALKNYIFSNIGIYNKIIMLKDKSKYKEKKSTIRRNILKEYSKIGKLDLTMRQRIELFMFKYVPFVYKYVYKLYDYKKTKNMSN